MLVSIHISSHRFFCCVTWYPPRTACARGLFIEHGVNRLAHRVARVPAQVLRPAGAVYRAEELDVVQLRRRKARQVIAEEEFQCEARDRVRDGDRRTAQLAEDGAQRDLAWSDDVVDALRLRAQ